MDIAAQALRSGKSLNSAKIMIGDWAAMLSRLDVGKLQGKTVLITGASGLIGSYLAGPIALANREKDLNCRLLCVSRGGAPEALAGLPGIEWLKRDLTQPFDHDGAVDYIIHAACPAQPSLWFANRMMLFDLNITATRHLLELARRHGASLLFLSSAEIYGDPPPGTPPLTEEYAGAPLATATRAIYGESKRMAEVMAMVYREDHQVRTISARISHLYGPGIGLSDKRVFADFMRQALSGQPIRLRDAGRATKTLGYVGDAALMMLNVLLHGGHPIYNIGGVDRIRVVELAREIAALAGGVEVILPEEASKERHIGSDAFVTCLDLGRYLGEFGPMAFTDLKSGLGRMIDWNRHE